MVSPENNSNWLFDYGLLEDIPVPSGDLPSFEPAFQWTSSNAAFTGSTAISAEFVDSFGTSDAIKDNGSRKTAEFVNLFGTSDDVNKNVSRKSAEFIDSFGTSDGIKENCSRKRVRSGSCSASDSKACREKKRRDRLNDRFQELSSILEPGRPAKMDKAVLLSDAVRMVNQLRDEAKKLKESHEDLQEKINELKVEKNELRDEKQKLKAEKEKLEQQMKSFPTQPGFLPSAVPAPFLGPGQVYGSKMVPFMGYPGVPMWQFTPPAAVDTTQDHVLRSPVA